MRTFLIVALLAIPAQAQVLVGDCIGTSCTEAQGTVFIGRTSGLPVIDTGGCDSPVKLMELTNDNGAVDAYAIVAVRVKAVVVRGGCFGPCDDDFTEYRLLMLFRGTEDSRFYLYPTLKAAQRDYRRLLKAAE